MSHKTLLELIVKAHRIAKKNGHRMNPYEDTYDKTGMYSYCARCAAWMASYDPPRDGKEIDGPALEFTCGVRVREEAWH